MLEQLLLPDLRAAIAEDDWQMVAAFGEELHPRDVALLLGHDNDPAALAQVFAHWAPEIAAPVFEYLPEALQDELVDRVPRQLLARMLERMSHDDRAHLVRRIDDDRLEKVMPLVAQADRADITRLASYEEGTAGAAMTSDYATLPANLTVAEALQRLRREAPDRETIYYLYVLDNDHDRKLLGFVSLKDLVLALPYRTVQQLMRTDVFAVRASGPVDDAAKKLAEYDLLALPVVDDEQRLVGIITHDDAYDIAEEAATEDIHRLGAVGPLTEGYLETSLAALWKKRVTWLSMLFIAELMTCYVMVKHQARLDATVALAIFLPLVISTGGNSGAQTSTLLTRALSLGEVGAKQWRRVFRRELALGLALGVSLGAIAFARVWLWPPPAKESVVAVAVSVMPLCWTVALTVAAICLWGSMIGAMLPLAFKRLGIDPAVASGPFVATFVDVTGILIYLTIADAILP